MKYEQDIYGNDILPLSEGFELESEKYEREHGKPPIDEVKATVWGLMLLILFLAWTLAAYYIIIPAVQAVWGWLA